MALNQTSLDPRSRPGTIFTGLGINPYEVWQGRVQQEADAAKLAAAKKAAEDKAKAEGLKLPTFKDVALPHSQEWLDLQAQYVRDDADRWRKFDQTKDEAYNPLNPASEAYKLRYNQIQALTQYASASNEKEKRYNAFRTKYDTEPNTFTPEEVESWESYYRSSPIAEISGTVVAPDILGTWNKTEDITKILGTITPTLFGGSTWDPENDWFSTSDGKRVTTDQLFEAAKANAGPRTKIGLQYMREYNLKPKEVQEQIAEEAKKNNLTIEQQLAYNDLYGYAYTNAKETKQKAGIYGSGTGKDQIESSDWWSYIVGGWGRGKDEAMRPVTIEYDETKGPGTFDVVEKQVEQAIQRAGIPAGVNQKALFDAWVKAGAPKNFNVSTALTNFPVEKRKVQAGFGTPINVNFIPSVVVSTVEPNGKKKYHVVVEPDVSDETLTEDQIAAVKSKFKPEVKVYSQDEIVTALWAGNTNVGNKSLNTAAAKRKLNEQGWGYEGTSGQWTLGGQQGETTPSTGVKIVRPTK